MVMMLIILNILIRFSICVCLSINTFFFVVVKLCSFILKKKRQVKHCLYFSQIFLVLFCFILIKFAFDECMIMNTSLICNVTVL